MPTASCYHIFACLAISCCLETLARAILARRIRNNDSRNRDFADKGKHSNDDFDAELDELLRIAELGSKDYR